MSNTVELASQLHRFPVPQEFEDTSFVNLSERARARFDRDAIRVPLQRSETFSHGSNTVLIMRTDLLPSGRFKYLSARTAAAELREAGHSSFVTPTAGSFGVALAVALQELGGEGIACTPIGASPKKQEAMRALGMTVIEGGANFDETAEFALQYAPEHDAQYVDPFASQANRAGTGILGLQLFEDCPEVTDVVLQYGGGSLLGGVAPVLIEQAAKAGQDVRITTVQVKGCSPFVDSVLSGEVCEASDRVLTRGRSFFASLGGVGVGKLDPTNLGIGSRAVDRVVTLPTDHVYATMYDCQQEFGVLPEFAAAPGIAHARALARSPDVNNATIVAMLTGADADNYIPGYLAGMSRRYAQLQHRIR